MQQLECVPLLYKFNVHNFDSHNFEGEGGPKILPLECLVRVLRLEDFLLLSESYMTIQKSNTQKFTIQLIFGQSIEANNICFQGQI